MALKYKDKYEKTKALKARKEKYEGSLEEEDEISILTRQVNHFWKKRQTKFRRQRRTGGHVESTYGKRKYGVDQYVTCFECQQLGNYRNGCPELMPMNKFSIENSKVLMATRDDSESLEDDSEEEQACMALMASSEAYDYGSESNSDSNVVFSNLTHSEVESCLTEIFEKF